MLITCLFPRGQMVAYCSVAQNCLFKNPQRLTSTRNALLPSWTSVIRKNDCKKWWWVTRSKFQTRKGG
jgi:hypothetical protein